MLIEETKTQRQNILVSLILIMVLFMKDTIELELAMRLRSIWLSSQQFSPILWLLLKKEGF